MEDLAEEEKCDWGKTGMEQHGRAQKWKMVEEKWERSKMDTCDLYAFTA